MSRVSQKTIKAIHRASVFDAVLRDRHESSLTGYFADHPPENWDDREKEDFDIATEVEYRIKGEILKILGAADPTEGA